jgi:hypothetical protein
MILVETLGNNLSESQRLTRGCGSVKDGGDVDRAYRTTTYLLGVLTDVEALAVPALGTFSCSVALMPAFALINRIALGVTPLADDAQTFWARLSGGRWR